MMAVALPPVSRIWAATSLASRMSIRSNSAPSFAQILDVAAPMPSARAGYEHASPSQIERGSSLLSSCRGGCVSSFAIALRKSREADGEDEHRAVEEISTKNGARVGLAPRPRRREPRRQGRCPRRWDDRGGSPSRRGARR